MGAVTPPSRTNNRPQLRVPDKIYEHTRKLGKTARCAFTTRRSRVIPICKRTPGLRRLSSSCKRIVYDDGRRRLFLREGRHHGGDQRDLHTSTRDRWVRIGWKRLIASTALGLPESYVRVGVCESGSGTVVFARRAPHPGGRPGCRPLRWARKHAGGVEVEWCRRRLSHRTLF